MSEAARDGNRVASLLLVDDVTGLTVPAQRDSSGRLKATAVIASGSSTQNIIVKKDDTTVGTRTTINLHDSATVTWTVTDDSGSGEVDITATGGSSLPVTDTTSIVKGSADDTKQVRIEADGLTTGTVRVWTAPDASGTVTLLGNSSTGSGNVVLATSPTLTTPVLGVATATTINKVTFTTPATGSTLTIDDGKTFRVSKTMQLTAADDTGVYTLPTGTKTLVATDVTTLSSLVSVGTITTGTWDATTVAVTAGGTGVESATAYAVLCGGTTSTGAFQSIASVGTSGQVLTSNGAGALPTFQDAAGSGTARRNMNLTSEILNTTGTAPVWDIGGIKCVSAASNGAQSINKFGMNDVGNFDLYDKNPEFNFTIDTINTATGTGRYFVGDTGGNLDPASTLTTKSCFFLIDSVAGTPTVYLVNANGTTNTNNTISGLTLTDTNHIRIVKNSTTSIKCYGNYTLKATNTTNLPSGDPANTDWWVLGVTNGGASATSRTLYVDYYDVLLDSPTG